MITLKKLYWKIFKAATGLPTVEYVRYIVGNSNVAYKSYKINMVVNRYLFGGSVAEIAKELGIPADKVTSELQRIVNDFEKGKLNG